MLRKDRIVRKIARPKNLLKLYLHPNIKTTQYIILIPP
jgi:hypothetical protein